MFEQKVTNKLKLSESTTLLIAESDKALNDSVIAEDQLAKQIYEIIEHFKQLDPIGLPLIPLPDPTVIKKTFNSISFYKIDFRMFRIFVKAFPGQTYT